MSTAILLIGEALIDEVHREDSVARYPGGSPANVALGLGRLGNDATLLSQWGEDPDGDQIASQLTASGVKICPGTRQREATSRAIATLDANGAASYDFQISWSPRPQGELPDFQHVHTGSIATVIEPGAATVAQLISEFSSHATISVDPNARPSLMGDPATAYATISQLLARADIIKASDEDIAWLTGNQPEAEVIAQWLAGGAALVVVTRGSQGVTAYCARGEVNFAAMACRVVDTVGAGDSLMGGLIDALARLQLLGAEHRSALRALELPVLSDILTWASVISAITVSRAGADPATTGEVRDFLTQRGLSVSFDPR